MESWNTGPIHMWLNRSGVERLAFPFQLTVFFFELQKLAGSLDCLIDFTNLNHTIFTKQHKSKCNSQKDYVFWPLPRVEPSVFFLLALQQKIFSLCGRRPGCPRWSKQCRRIEASQRESPQFVYVQQFSWPFCCSSCLAFDL